MKPHQFQFVARQYRSGKISLDEFTNKVCRAPRHEPTTSTASESPSSDPIDTRQLLLTLLEREVNTHKGNFGHVLVIAGSPGMAGAAAMTGKAALRSGAGLVSVMTDFRCQETVASFHPSLMTIGINLDSDYDSIAHHIEAASCVAIGPGLGIDNATQSFIQEVVANCDKPIVVDADGLNALANQPTLNAPLPCRGKLVLTPHPGELKRWMQKPSDDRPIQVAFAEKLAEQTGSVVVLKGHQTVITDGKRRVTNSTGNPGMATAGSGDTLTGIIASFIGQGLSTWEAAVLGCYVHGRAGDEAAKRKSQIALLATDIIDFLPAVFGKP